MTKRNVETSNKHVQTTIHCYPYVLLSNSELAKVFSDRGCQTAATTTPDTTNLNFYASLEFTPYQVIAEGSIREIDLPRKALLQWNLASISESDIRSGSSNRIPEREESETSRQKSALKKSELSTETSLTRVVPLHNSSKMQKPNTTSQEVQTNLSVSPHVLDTDEVANVFTEISMQTSITCLPNESISNILPQLKANISHASGYNETASVVSRSAEKPLNEEEEQEVNQQIEEFSEDEPSSETPQKPSQVPPDDQIEQVTVTVSSAQVKSTRSCSCGTRMLNQIASKLRVQASTLKLTPKVFPPGAPFNERMMEVLNTTIAVLQTEMAKLMEIYVEEDRAICACSEKTAQKSVEDIKNDPRSCKCGAKAEAKINQDDYQLAVTSDPRSCKCGAGTVPQGKTDKCASGGQKEIKRMTATRQIMNPNTMQPDFVKEDIVEEITRTVTSSGNNETIVEEKIITKTVREKLPGSPDAKKLMIEGTSSKTMAKPCQCSSKAMEIIKPADDDVLAETETEDLVEPPSEATEAPVEVGELSEEGDELLDEPDETENVEVEPPPLEREIVGDSSQIKRLSFIPCECHPTETGAATPILGTPGPSRPQVTAMSEKSLDPCSCPENMEFSTDIANASSFPVEQPSMVTDDATSLPDDAASAEKTVKFEILLKKGVADVQSVSATSAIVVRATISCPDTSKDGKKKVSTGNSLPDLREQVIRLSVIYKNGSTEPEQRIEELLTPGRQITIAPNKSQSSRVDQKAKPAASFNKNASVTDGRICECGRLACANVSSNKISHNKPRTVTSRVGDASTNLCECAQQGSSRRQPSSNQPLPIEIEEVPSSSMACPVHPTKPPSCIPSCTPRSTPSSALRSTPSSQRPPTKAANATDLEIIISYTVGGSEDEKLRKSSFMYEHDATYDEPYMEELMETEDATAAVQTDLTLGDKLESESLSSLPELDGQAPQECSSKTEMPWQKISLPPPGSYRIKQMKESKPTSTTGKEAGETLEETEEDGGGGEEPEEGGAQEGGAQEGGEEESVAESPPPRGPKQLLLYESEIHKHNEPYMEGLYRAFPNSDDEAGECGSQTEMPWKDILLPKNCRIKKMKKTKKCTCKSRPEKLSGMFIPSNTPPRRLDDDEDEPIVDIHLGFDEQPSNIMRVNEGGAMSQRTLSFVSTVSEMHQAPKRVPKDFTLLLNLSKSSSHGVSFQAGKGEPQNILMGSSIRPTSSQPFAISASQEASSVIINIKPSTENPYQSERIRVPGGNDSVELQVVEPQMYIGPVPTETKSCTSTNTSKMKGSIKITSSMPQIPSQSVKATVSLKRLGEPDKVVSDRMDLVPGENLMTLKVPQEPITVKLKMSTPNTQIQAASKGPTSTVPKEVFSPAICPCKDKVKLDTFRQDPVMAALEAYEAEMRPLRQALTQLQQKIRNLNMPEMKGCLCTTALRSPPHSPRPHPNTMGSYGGAQGTCPYFQAAAFRSPQSPPAMYGRLPPPILPPRNQPYMAPAPNYTPPNATQHQQSCYCDRGESPPSRSSGRRRQNRERQSNRDHGRSYPKEDLAMQARHHGMYPDYRGRKYADEKAAYQDSFVDTQRRKGRSREKYKVRNVISIHSSGNVTSDYEGYDSQGASEGEDLCPLAVSDRKRHKQKDKRGRHGNSSKTSSRFSTKSSKQGGCAPCREGLDSPQLREGQAVKTSPDEFLSSSHSAKRKGQCCGAQSSSSYGVQKVISKSKIQIKFPRN